MVLGKLSVPGCLAGLVSGLLRLRWARMGVVLTFLLPSITSLLSPCLGDGPI